MLSLVLPTYNEAQNLPELLPRIEAALAGTPFEIIIVDDDSPDETWKTAESYGHGKSQIRVLRRVGRRGLSSAVIEGFLAATGDVLAVMDADLQHDPQLLTKLSDAVHAGNAVAIGSRYVPGGSVEGWAKPRHAMSVAATALSWLVSSVRVHDPMSGFFAIDRTIFLAIEPSLRPRGFKILLEILSALPRGARVAEIPLVFRTRRYGESKLSLKVEGQFLVQMWSLFSRRWNAALFAVASVAIIAALLPRAWSLSPLIFDPSLRAQAQEALTHVADEQGWLLSDVELTRVTSSELRVLHRPHLRGTDPATCSRIALPSFELTPCTDAR